MKLHLILPLTPLGEDAAANYADRTFTGCFNAMFVEHEGSTALLVTLYSQPDITLARTSPNLRRFIVG